MWAAASCSDGQTLHHKLSRPAFRPVSPYGAGQSLRDSHGAGVSRDLPGLYACNAICYNHESPRRGQSFVTRKITSGVAAIVAKKSKSLVLGSLDAQRDWGYAPEYVEGYVANDAA